jgi:hypothetical protein
MATTTYNMTLDEALAKKFEKIMVDVRDVAETEEYATDMFLFLREVVIPDFKRFLADGGYEIAKVQTDTDLPMDTCCSSYCRDCGEGLQGTRLCSACTDLCPCVKAVRTHADTD